MDEVRAAKRRVRKLWSHSRERALKRHRFHTTILCLIACLPFPCICWVRAYTELSSPSVGYIIMAEISGCLDPASVLPGYGSSSPALPPPISGLFVLMLCDMAHCFVHLWLRVNGQRVYEGSGQEKKRSKGQGSKWWAGWRWGAGLTAETNKWRRWTWKMRGEKYGF